jgi:hypothetical protein
MARMNTGWKPMLLYAPLRVGRGSAETSLYPLEPEANPGLRTNKNSLCFGDAFGASVNV